MSITSSVHFIASYVALAWVLAIDIAEVIGLLSERARRMPSVWLAGTEVISLSLLFTSIVFVFISFIDHPAVIPTGDLPPAATARFNPINYWRIAAMGVHGARMILGVFFIIFGCVSTFTDR
jgi:hypothetical protein